MLATEEGRRPGQLFVVSAPSGVGKTTILKGVLKDDPQLRYSVSSTTRPPRRGELDGRDYHFVTRHRFVEGVRTGRFLEWAEVHGHLYGTDRRRVTSWIQEGFDVVLDIDVQGARQVRCAHPRVQTIFILPPSWDELRKRLEARGTENSEQVTRRLTAAQNEVQDVSCYDFIVVNDRLDEAIMDVTSILRSHRLCWERQAATVRTLLSVESLDRLNGPP